MSANAGYTILIALMLVPIVWLAWIESDARYALVCLAILGGVIWLLNSLAEIPQKHPHDRRYLRRNNQSGFASRHQRSPTAAEQSDLDECEEGMERPEGRYPN